MVELITQENVQTKRTLKRIHITRDIYFFEHEILHEKTKAFYQSGIAYEGDINAAMPFVNIPCIKDVHLFHKSFLDWYKDNGFGIGNFIEKVWNDIKSLNVFSTVEQIENMEDYVLLQYSSYSETAFDLDGNNLEHMKPYNHSCYMVTNNKYDLVSLLEFLNQSDKVVVVSEGIEDIPYYNRYEEDGDSKFINFYVRVQPEQFNLLDVLYFKFPKEILDISQFRI
jgi:hypothetical protein